MKFARDIGWGHGDEIGIIALGSKGPGSFPRAVELLLFSVVVETLG
jgi:hypothetical protein